MFLYFICVSTRNPIILKSRTIIIDKTIAYSILICITYISFLVQKITIHIFNYLRRRCKWHILIMMLIIFNYIFSESFSTIRIEFHPFGLSTEIPMSPRVSAISLAVPESYTATRLTWRWYTYIWHILILKVKIKTYWLRQRVRIMIAVHIGKPPSRVCYIIVIYRSRPDCVQRISGMTKKKKKTITSSPSVNA